MNQLSNDDDNHRCDDRWLVVVDVSSPSVPTPTTPENIPSQQRPIDESRTEQIVRYINSITLLKQKLVGPHGNGTTTTKSDLVSEQALAWIIDEDPLQLWPDTPSHRFQLMQRYALRTLLGQQFVPNAWSNTSSTWALSECEWVGINCTTSLVLFLDDDDDNVGVQQQDVVTKMSFLGYSMNGILPSDLGLLYSLVHMELYNGVMQGTFPESVGNWRNVSFVHFRENRFSGSLPLSIGNWQNITTVSFGANELTGSLPSSVGNWNRIKFMDVSSNTFTGTLPTSIGNWKELVFVFFYDNQFSGTIPTSIGTSWTNLEYAYLPVNNFTGEVPTGLCEFTSLSSLEADCVSKVNCSCCTTCY